MAQTGSLDSGTTDSKGNLVLTSPYALNEAKEFVIRKGTSDVETEVKRITVTPVSLTSIRLVSDNIVLKGDTLLLTAQINANISDLSGYTIVFSGAITGSYTTNRNGQVSLYYTGQGTGSKSVTVTAGNWNATTTFEDVLTFWKIGLNTYIEKYTRNQGFKKLSQYYSLDSSVNNMGLLCIGDYNLVSDWQLSFTVQETVSNIHFDICTWSGNPESINDLNATRTVTFYKGDVIVATCINGNLVVKQNNNTLFTKSVNPNQYPALAVFSDNLASVTVNQQNTITVRTLKFDELKLMGI